MQFNISPIREKLQEYVETTPQEPSSESETLLPEAWPEKGRCVFSVSIPRGGDNDCAWPNV